MHENAAAEIRKKVQQSARKYRERWEPKLKTEILEFITVRRKRGASYTTISKEIGVPFATIAEWAQELRTAKSRKPTFQRVEVREEKARSLVLVHPSGVRVEGVDVATAAAILKALL